MNLQTEGQKVQTQSNNLNGQLEKDMGGEISFLDSISEPVSSEALGSHLTSPVSTQVSHQMSLQLTLDEIAEQNSTSADSKELPTKSLVQVDEGQNLLDVHGNLENIAQRIFDQDIHDLEFQESEAANSNSSEASVFSGSSFVEVSHFSFFTPATEESSSRDQAEDVPMAESLGLEASSILSEDLSLSRAPGLCDDLLIKEIQSIPQRLSFKIGDVADLLGIKPFVLRYWETEFEVLKPKKAQNKQRMYSRKQVEIAFLVRKLLHRDRYSIEGARNAMKAARQSLKQRLEEMNQPVSVSPGAASIPSVSAEKSSRAEPSGASTDSSVSNVSAIVEGARAEDLNMDSVHANSSQIVLGTMENSEVAATDEHQMRLMQNLGRLRVRVQALRRVTQEFRDQMNFR